MYAATYSTLKSCWNSAHSSAATATHSAAHIANTAWRALCSRSRRPCRPPTNPASAPQMPTRKAIHRHRLPRTVIYAFGTAS